MHMKLSGIKLPNPSSADRNISVASKGHCTAYAVLGDDEGYRVQAESHLELCNLMILNARQDVVSVKEQARFDWQENGRSKKHYFDALAFLKCGRRIAYTVKPERRISSGKFLDQMRDITRHALDAGFCSQVVLVTEKDIGRIDQRNAMMFNAVRQKDPEAEAVALEVVAGMIGSATLRDLTIKTNMAARGYRALIRLLRSGHLIASNHEVITPKTLVQLSGEVQ